MKQAQLGNLQGTFDNLTFYKLEGKFYVRLKSSLTAKRVKKDPAFRNTMKSAGELAKASRLAAIAYHSIPKMQRYHALFRTLTGIAKKALASGREEKEIQADLLQYLVDLELIPQQQAIVKEDVIRLTTERSGNQVKSLPDRPGTALIKAPALLNRLPRIVKLPLNTIRRRRRVNGVSMATTARRPLPFSGFSNRPSDGPIFLRPG